MKKLLTLTMAVGISAFASACNSVPECMDELDNCNRNAAYTEERTAPVHTVAQPAPETTPVVAEQEPLVEETVTVEVKPEPAPAPTPEPVEQKPVMTSAEPQFKQISKK